MILFQLQVHQEVQNLVSKVFSLEIFELGIYSRFWSDFFPPFVEMNLWVVCHPEN